MTREIKFRAWHKENGMTPVKFMDFTVLGMIPEPKGIPSVMENGDYVIMQYTGLKDKNGKEIYEDDILEDEEGDRYQVRYTDAARFVADLNGEKGFVYDEFSLDDGHWLIIGNIYDNPELLKQ